MTKRHLEPDSRLGRIVLMKGKLEPTLELSVVIPTRDRAEAVERAVASVLDHSKDNVEVVVFDDGSVDATVERMERLADPRLKLIIGGSPGGANRARNRGARASRAPLIAFLDSDDVFLPQRCERLIRFFSEHPEIDCTIDGYVDHACGRIRTHQLSANTPDSIGIRHLLVSHQLPLTNSTVTIRRDVFEAIGGYDEQLMRHQDRELLLRVCHRHRLAFGAATNVHKFRGDGSISHELEGYVGGIDAFSARVPEAKMPQYEDLFRYLAVRGVIKSMLQGHMIVAWREIQSLRRSMNLPKGFVKSLLRYSAGRRFRARPGHFDKWPEDQSDDTVRTVPATPQASCLKFKPDGRKRPT